VSGRWAQLRRFYVAALIALLAAWIARGLGIPIWREWDPGDCVDIGFFAFLLAMATLPKFTQGTPS
jgi:hypothetical protein